MNRYLSKVTWKGLMIAILVVAVGLGAGVAVLWTSGDVKADSGLSPGFMKGTNPSKPDPKMIEEGKKIYFRKCVWCRSEERRVGKECTARWAAGRWRNRQRLGMGARTK